MQSASNLISYLSEYILFNGGFDEAANLIEYAAQRPSVVKVGEHGLFSAIPNINLEEAKQEISSHKGNVYTHVLSLRREDAARLGFDSQEPWRNLIMSKIDIIANVHNIDLKDLRWYAAMHNTGNHPHVHLFVYADDNAAKQPFLKEKGLRKMKSEFAKEIFKEERHNIYVNKEQYKKALNLHAKGALDALLKKPLAYYDNEQLHSLIIKMNELSAQLPEKGKEKYGFMPKDIKRQIDDIQRHIVYDNKMLNQLYMGYCNEQFNLEKMYVNEPHQAPVDKIEAFKPIKNAILKHAYEIRQYGLMGFDNEMTRVENETSNFSPEPPPRQEVSPSVSIEFSTKSQGTDTNNSRNSFPKESSTQKNPITQLREGESGTDHYRQLQYRKHLNYNKLQKQFPFLKGYGFEGNLYDKKFQALKILSDDMNLRNGEICRELADCYYYGNGCEKDINSAFLWYGIAADQFKDSYANYRLGQIYYNGADDIEIDTELGSYYSKTAYIEFRDEIENTEYFSRMEQGNSDLVYYSKVSADDAYKEYLIGRLFLKGHGVEQNYNSAFNSFLLSAENGYAHANYYIGNMYYYGLGFEQDYLEAFGYYQAASDNRDSYADYRLGKMYQKGEGININLIEAERHYQKSHLKVVMANYDLARLYETNTDTFDKSDDEIFSLYQAALEGLIMQEEDIHNDFTEIRIGNMYLSGKGTEQNIEKAIEWFEKAAEQNNPDALYQLGYIYGAEAYSVLNEEKSNEYYSRALAEYINAEKDNANANAECRIGRMYVNGMGTEANGAEGVRWLEKSALNNNSDAAYQLYKLYSEGELIESDHERAVQFLEISARLDNPYAQYAFGKLKLDDGDVKESIKWLEQASDKNMPYASYKLGTVYASDEYGQLDEEKSQKFYSKALSDFETVYQENPDDLTAYQIAGMYLSGKGTEQNIEKAIEWFEKAAEQNNPDALYQLGYIYRNENYGVSDMERSNEFFKLAYERMLNHFADCPNGDTAYQIGTLFHYGLGVECDIDKAIEWYKKSLELGNQKAQQKINEAEETNHSSAMAIASTAAHLGRMIDTETHAAFKQKYTSDKKILREEKIKKIEAGQAVDDKAYDYDY